MTGHDAPEAEEASVSDLRDKKIALELTLILKASGSVDWFNRKSVRAAKRMHIQLILSNFNYPPNKPNEAM